MPVRLLESTSKAAREGVRIHTGVLPQLRWSIAASARVNSGYLN